MQLHTTFYIRPETKGSEKPIYVLCRCGKNLIRLSTGLSIPKRDWSHKGGYPTKKKETIKIRERLDGISKKMEDWFIGLETPTEATKTRIKDQLKKVVNGDVGNEKDLWEAFDEFIEFQRRQGKAKKTLDKYQLVKETVKEHNPDLSFNDLNDDHYQSLIEYLAFDKGIINKTTNKYLQCFSSFLNWCNRKGIINQRLSLYYKELDEAEQAIINVNDDEFRKLETAKVENPKLDKVRDLFVVSAHTGVRYKDLTSISRGKIEGGLLHMIADKTKTEYYVAVSDKVYEILEKYDYELPSYSNQRLNDYLKELFEYLNFNRTIYLKGKYLDKEEYWKRKLYQVVTTHSGRKTYITDKLRDGHNQELVKSTAGMSKNSKSFQRYVQFHQQDVLKMTRKNKDKDQE